MSFTKLIKVRQNMISDKGEKLQKITVLFCNNKGNKPAAGCRRRPSPAEASPIGQINPFSKMALTFGPLMGF